MIFIWKGMYWQKKKQGQIFDMKFHSMRLKPCVCYFLSIFFSPNDSHSKTMKNAFYFILKALFVLKTSKDRHSFLSTLSRFKRTNGVKSFMMSWIGFHKFPDVIFGITQKSFNITSSNLVRQYITNKRIFLNLFCNLKSDWSQVPGPLCFW